MTPLWPLLVCKCLWCSYLHRSLRSSFKEWPPSSRHFSLAFRKSLNLQLFLKQDKDLSANHCLIVLAKEGLHIFKHAEFLSFFDSPVFLCRLQTYISILKESNSQKSRSTNSRTNLSLFHWNIESFFFFFHKGICITSGFLWSLAQRVFWHLLL